MRDTADHRRAGEHQWPPFSASLGAEPGPIVLHGYETISSGRWGCLGGGTSAPRVSAQSGEGAGGPAGPSPGVSKPCSHGWGGVPWSWVGPASDLPGHSLLRLDFHPSPTPRP